MSLEPSGAERMDRLISHSEPEMYSKNKVNRESWQYSRTQLFRELWSRNWIKEGIDLFLFHISTLDCHSTLFNWNVKLESHLLHNLLRQSWTNVIYIVQYRPTEWMYECTSEIEKKANPWQNEE